MKVCNCCYHPELIEDNPFGAMFISHIRVPDNTPIAGTDGVIRCISPKVLEVAGMKWGGNNWLKPDGESIEPFAFYDITVTEGHDIEPWERALFADIKQNAIVYLQSRAKDDSTLGEGTHTKRQAKVLLKLWDEHVLGDYKPELNLQYLRGGVFIGNYGRTKALDISDPFELNMDLKGLEAVNKNLQADSAKVQEMAINPADGTEQAMQYCYKLRRSMEDNLANLELATKATDTMYSLGDLKPDNLGLIMATFQSRHSTWIGGAAVKSIYQTMLPILTAKLSQLGFADSIPGLSGGEDGVEWDYS